MFILLFSGYFLNIKQPARSADKLQNYFIEEMVLGFLPDKKKHRMSPSLNLWFRKDPAHLYKLRKDLQKRKTGRVRRSIRALYPCCNYLNIVPVEKSDGTSVTEVKLTK